jgi:DNA invertase Pin-like site-specific DNA recombinase
LGKSAALYCRVSTADQTCARQERDLRAFAKKAGYKIVGVWKETASGAKDDRAQRKEVLALAQARKIDVILVTELTRWGRSMLDLFHTLQDLQAWDVSLVAQTGLQFDLRSAQGKLIASLMAALAEFERDLLRERVRSGIAAARKRGVVFGRRPGQRVKADRFAPRVLKLVGEGQSYREIGHRLGLSKYGPRDRQARACGMTGGNLGWGGSSKFDPARICYGCNRCRYRSFKCTIDQKRTSGYWLH